MSSHHRLSSLTAAFSLILLAAPPASAQVFGTDPDAGRLDYDRTVFFFGGRFQEGLFEDFTRPTTLTFEDAYFLGAGAQYFFLGREHDMHVGLEAGIAGRFSPNDPASVEAWGGIVLRHDGLVFFDSFRVSPSVTLGVSMVSAPVGVEAERAAIEGSDPHVLVYLAPELIVTPVAMPDTEFFLRLQHRSGGLGLITNFDGSNAVTAGIRLKY